jgi:hypothetical protein
MEGGTSSRRNNSLYSTTVRQVSDGRGWLEWFGFLVFLFLWVLGLVSGRDFHGFIHLLLLAAVYLLIDNIASHGGIGGDPRGSVTPR